MHCLVVRLNEKLKESLNSQLPANGGMDTEPLQGDEQVLQNMQMQIETVLQVTFVTIIKMLQHSQQNRNLNFPLKYTYQLVAVCVLCNIFQDKEKLTNAFQLFLVLITCLGFRTS